MAVQIPYEQILQTITEKSGLPQAEIEAKVEAKLEQLSGLISKEGAGHIIANELGIKLIEQTSGRLTIGSILTGMRDVETVGKVVRIFETREFESARGPGKVASFILGDESGTLRVVLWNDQAEMATKFKEGSVLKIVGGYTKSGRNDDVEMHVNSRSKIIIDPEGETVNVATPTLERKKIAELTEQDSNAEVLGTVYQVFEPRFFEICPECNRRIRDQNGAFSCETHGPVTPSFSYVFNLFLDDGSSTIRLVCFRDQALQVLGLQNDEFLRFKDDPAAFEQTKNDLLGKIIKVVGRVTKNDMFDRLEFIAQRIDANPDPQAEMERAKQEDSQSAPAPSTDSDSGPAQETVTDTPENIPQVEDVVAEPQQNTPAPEPTPEASEPQAQQPQY